MMIFQNKLAQRILAGILVMAGPLAYVVYQHIGFESHPDSKKRMLIRQAVFWTTFGVGVAGMHMGTRQLLKTEGANYLKMIGGIVAGALLPIFGFEAGRPIARWLVPKKSSPPSQTSPLPMLPSTHSYTVPSAMVAVPTSTPGPISGYIYHHAPLRRNATALPVNTSLGSPRFGASSSSPPQATLPRMLVAPGYPQHPVSGSRYAYLPQGEYLNVQNQAPAGIRTHRVQPKALSLTLTPEDIANSRPIPSYGNHAGHHHELPPDPFLGPPPPYSFYFPPLSTRTHTYAGSRMGL